MEPSTKKRKLAPKVNNTLPADAKPQPTQHHVESQHYPVQEPPYTERHDFESFARHLQDAAMLIQRQMERPSYAEASVLLLRWEEDESTEQELAALEKVFQTNYHYRTQQWLIPTVPNPSAKLSAQVAQFLDTAKPNNLLIIYYAGHGLVGSDGQLYWACNAREDAAKLKWGGVSCLLENAQSDILLLLDTCAIPDPAASGSHGVKQTIAACTPDQDIRGGIGRSFTSNLTDALQKLGNGRPFSAQRLHEEVLSQQQRQNPPTPPTNGASSTQSNKLPRPIFFTVTPGKGQSLTLSPLSGRPSNGVESSTHATSGREESLIEHDEAAGVRLDEHRILVCTTFVGDASPDMSYFHQWLQNTPPLGSKIAVEGIFLGPPTMLLISMPHSIWNVVQHDKVCCFLGYISSHNMLHLYEKLVGPAVARPSAKAVEDGRILLEAREIATSTPKRSRDHDARERPQSASAAMSKDSAQAGDRLKYRPQSSPNRGQFPSASPKTPAVTAATTTTKNGKPKEENEGNEGSKEMREAAEQLKALSHVRHRSDENPRTGDRPRTSLPNGMSEARRNELPSHDPDGSDTGDKTTPGRIKVPRRALPKHETRCSHCSHAPFRDSSSLRKHIAAAHTRPFPCAFSFAGCNSTFGSKNEWKRHITSQHLCLQYYRCSSCPGGSTEGKGNEFNRKDLFTQHLRRMHAPFQIKRPASKGDVKIQAEWELHVRSMQQSCLVNRRYPPQKSACPNPDCRSVFEGPGSWDEWTEHVGRHMEKGEGGKLSVDRHLIDWALDENIIESRGGGNYRLSSGNGTGNGNSNGASDRFEERTIVVSKLPRQLSEPILTESESTTAKETESASTGEPMEVDK